MFGMGFTLWHSICKLFGYGSGKQVEGSGSTRNRLTIRPGFDPWPGMVLDSEHFGFAIISIGSLVGSTCSCYKQVPFDAYILNCYLQGRNYSSSVLRQARRINYPNGNSCEGRKIVPVRSSGLQKLKPRVNVGYSCVYKLRLIMTYIYLRKIPSSDKDNILPEPKDQLCQLLCTSAQELV